MTDVGSPRRQSMKLKSLVAALAAAACLPAMSATIYSNDFEANAAGFTGAGSLQGTQGYAGLGYGQQFLRNDTGGNPQTASVLNLNLAGAATGASLSLDLGIIDSWDGFNCCGPDFFNVKVDGVLVFSKNFSIFDGPAADPALVLKHYGPNLGFNGGWGDQAYGLTLALGNLAAGAHTVEFYASGGWQAGLDESWGVDNVLVSGDLANPIPEPETYALMLAGLGVVAAVARRRRSR
jgi:hypothetical protein